MQLLEPNIQNYHWGDKEFLAHLQGRTPTEVPEAELWMGAHQTSPSRVSGGDQNLKDIIDSDPENTLGLRAKEFRNELPYIMKVLAIGSPLSLQVHPSESQAMAGYDREINLDTHSEKRSYFSPRGKKEIVCALTKFEAKYGFRKISEITTIMAAANTPEGSELVEILKGNDSEDKKLRRTISKILNYSPSQIREMATTISKADIQSTVISERESEHFTQLAEMYPSDPGVIIFLFLNFVTLQPGEAMYVPPGVIHAYLRGSAIEITSNSDNVLRCGLTSKHIDKEEFLSLALFAARDPNIQKPGSAYHFYESPTEFTLSRLEIEQEWATNIDSAEILISTEGSFTISNPSGESINVDQGTPVWVPSADQRYTLSGKALIFRCSSA